MLRNEPLRRGWGEVHVLERAVRRGGTAVYVNDEHPSGASQAASDRLRGPEARAGWRRMVRDPGMYAEGTVRHLDHATVVLHDWHRVLQNTEHRAGAMRHVAFLD